MNTHTQVITVVWSLLHSVQFVRWTNKDALRATFLRKCANVQQYEHTETTTRFFARIVKFYDKRASTDSLSGKCNFLFNCDFLLAFWLIFVFYAKRVCLCWRERERKSENVIYLPIRFELRFELEIVLRFHGGCCSVSAFVFRFIAIRTINSNKSVCT